MSRYTPDPPPNNQIPEDIENWVWDELLRLRDVIEQMHDHEILHIEPTGKLYDGMVRYADGTDWNPGSGEGFYGREGAAWVKL